jgi:hypothetical protein
MWEMNHMKWIGIDILCYFRPSADQLNIERPKVCHPLLALEVSSMQNFWGLFFPIISVE